MKQLFGLLLILSISLTSTGQTLLTQGGPRTTIENTGSFKVDSVFELPIRDTGSWGYYPNFIDSAGRMTFQKSDSQVYFFNGIYWQKLINSGSSSNVVTVPTIAALEAYNGNASQIIVSDSNRGGLFYKSLFGINDSGICFPSSDSHYWKRIYNGDIVANWYGAVGDSATDCTIPFRLCFSSPYTNKNYVRLRSGNYLVSDTILINQQMRLNGSAGFAPYRGSSGISPVGQYAGGSSVIIQTADKNLFHITVNGVFIDGLTLKNSAPTVNSSIGLLVDSGYAFKLHNTFLQGFYDELNIGGGSEITISENQFVNPQHRYMNFGGYIGDEGDNLVQGNWFENITSVDTGVYVTQPAGFRFFDNKMHIPVGQTVGNYLSVAVFVEALSTTSDVSICRNSIEAYQNAGIVVSTDNSHSLFKVLITNNNTTNNTGGNLHNIVVTTPNANRINNVSIYNNVISQVGTWAPILMNNVNTFILENNHPSSQVDSLINCVGRYGRTLNEALSTVVYGDTSQTAYVIPYDPVYDVVNHLGFLQIKNPEGASFSKYGIFTGAVKFQLPFISSTANDIMRFDITITQLNTPMFQQHIQLSTYYIGSSHTWSSPSAIATPGGNIPIRMSTNGVYPSMIIGDTTTTWNDVSISVNDINVSSGAFATLYPLSSGWLSSLITSWNGLTVTPVTTSTLATTDQIVDSGASSGVAVFPTISSMEVYSGLYTKAIVTDTNSGGSFYSMNTGTPDSGTVFKGSNGGFWHRIYSGALNVKWFRALGDSGITDNSVPIQAAFNAAPNGGTVIFPDNGRYYVSHPLFVNKQISIRGLGSRYTYDYATGQYSGSAMLFCNSDTMTLLTINVKGVNINNMSFVNTTTDTASAGYGIKNNSAGTFTMNNCTIYKFWQNMYIYDGFSWNINNSIFLNPTGYNLTIQNPILTYDAGDNNIVNCQFLTYRNDTEIGWFSSGGLKLVNDKFHPMLAASGPFNTGLFVNVDSPGTSDLQMSNCSFEDFSGNGIYVQPKTNAGFSNVTLNGCQFYPIHLVSGSAINIRRVFNVNIIGGIVQDGNSNTNPAIHLAQVTNGNIIAVTNQGWATKIKLDTCTNVDTANGSITSATGDVVGTKNGSVLNTTINSVTALSGPSTLKYYPNALIYSNITSYTGATIIHTNIPRASYNIGSLHVTGGVFSTSSNINFTAQGYANGGVNGSIDGQPGAIIGQGISDVGNDGLSKYIGVDSNGDMAIAIGDTNSNEQYIYFKVDYTNFLGVVAPASWYVTGSKTTNFNWKDIYKLTSTVSTNITGTASGSVNGTANKVAMFTGSNVVGNAPITVSGNNATVIGTIGASNLSGTNTGDQNITLGGDVTGSGTSAITATIGANKVTYAKIQTETASTLLGNPTGSTANTSAITLGSGLSFSGTTLVATGSGGTVTSITPVYGFTSSTPITTSGTLTVDSTKLATKAYVNSISGVTSASNSDGTLTMSPTTGAVVASLNLAHYNSWTAQKFGTINVTGLDTLFTTPSSSNSDSILAKNSSKQTVSIPESRFVLSGSNTLTPSYGFTNNTPFTLPGTLPSIDSSKFSSTYALTDTAQIIRGGMTLSTVMGNGNSTSFEYVGTSQKLSGNDTVNGSIVLPNQNNAGAVLYTDNNGKVQNTNTPTTGYVLRATSSSASSFQQEFGYSVFAGNHNATSTDNFMVFDCSSGNDTCFIPASGIPTGKPYFIKLINLSGSNKLIVTGSTTIDGLGNSFALTNNNQAIALFFDGAKYQKFADYYQNDSVKNRITYSGTATLSSGTVTVSTSNIITGTPITITLNTPSGTSGFLSAPNASIVNGTSFVINSNLAAGTLNTADNSTVNWSFTINY